MKKLALCIHDLRLSEPERSIKVIEYILQEYNHIPLTVHMIMDKEIEAEDSIIKYLMELIKKDKVELVFHGIIHSCKHGEGRAYSWYHQYQAEFISNSFSKEVNQTRFNQLTRIFDTNLGFCPPCWIASKKARKFWKLMNPLYFENLFTINFSQSYSLSTVISLGNDKRMHLFLLKKVASLILNISIYLRIKNLRLVIHTTDLPVGSSMLFFSEVYNRLRSEGYFPVLQKYLI